MYRKYPSALRELPLTVLNWTAGQINISNATGVPVHAMEVNHGT